MHCLDTQTELEAYVEGELSQERVALLESHLAGCASCRARLARLQTVEEALATWPLVAEPAGLTARVMAQVKPRPVEKAAGPPTPARFRLRWGDLAISLAGAAGALLTGYFLIPTSTTYLYRTQDALRLEMLPLEMLQLDLLLQVQRLVESGAAMWILLLAGAVAALALIPVVWSSILWRRKWFPARTR